MASGPRHFDGVADLLPVFLAIVDRNTSEVVDVNTYGLEMLGYQLDDVVGSDFRDIVHEIDQRPDQLKATEAGPTLVFERRLQAANGEFHLFNMSGRAMPGQENLLMVAARPMQELADADSSFADILQLAELTDDLFVVFDEDGRIRYANRAARDLHGVGEPIGREITEFLHESDTGFPALLSAYSNEDNRASGRVLAVGPDGVPVPLGVKTVYDPGTKRWFTVERDVSDLVRNEERLALLAEDLERRALTDDLTGVANRYRINELITSATSQNKPFSLLMMDMDDFKSVNDTLGHAAGDELLITVAQRLGAIAGTSGVVGRLGGDEFVLFLPGADEMTAATVAATIIDSIGQPFSISGVEISRSCSIGVALSEPGDTTSTVLRRADQAAYDAKHAGRSRFKVHSGQSESWPTVPGNPRRSVR